MVTHDRYFLDRVTTVSYTHLDVYKRQVKACFPRKNFCQRAIEQEVNRQILDVALVLFLALYDLVGSSAEEAFHVCKQFLVVELLDAGKAFCKNFTMAPVGTKDIIIFIQQICLPNSGRLLAERKVSRARVVVPVSYTHLDVYKRQAMFCTCDIDGGNRTKI